jgi:hypothetical protein
LILVAMVEQTFYISDHICNDYRCRTVYSEDELHSDWQLQQYFKLHGKKPRIVKFRAWNFDIDRSTFHAFFKCLIQFQRWKPRYILQDNGFRREARIELLLGPRARMPSLALSAKEKALILNKLVALGYSIVNKEREKQELLIYRTYSQFPYRWDIVEAWSIGTYHTDKEKHRHAIREKYPA